MGACGKVSEKIAVYAEEKQQSTLKETTLWQSRKKQNVVCRKDFVLYIEAFNLISSLPSPTSTALFTTTA